MRFSVSFNIYTNQLNSEEVLCEKLHYSMKVYSTYIKWEILFQIQHCLIFLQILLMVILQLICKCWAFLVCVQGIGTKTLQDRFFAWLNIYHKQTVLWINMSATKNTNLPEHWIDYGDNRWLDMVSFLWIKSFFNTMSWFTFSFYLL